jgi:hypothetical protein
VQDAVAFFEKSGLSREVLAQVRGECDLMAQIPWYSTGTHVHTRMLTRAHMYVIHLVLVQT